MFDDIFEMSTVRSRKQAFGFYLFYVVITIAAGAFLGALMGLWISEVGEIATNTGITIAMLVSLLLSGLIIRAKSILSAKTASLLLLGGVLGFFGGVVLGLIPVAYMTTLSPKNMSQAQELEDESKESAIATDLNT